MEIKLKSEMPFIQLDGAKEGTIKELGGGSYSFSCPSGKGGTFKQILKQGEYDQMVANSKGDSTSSVSAKSEKEDEEVSRQEELESMKKEELLDIANKLYENVDPKSKKNELINVIIEGEKEDGEEK